MVRLLEQHFHDYVDYEFTADMEDDLDQIANGRGRTASLAQALLLRRATPSRGLLSIVDNLGEIDAREINSIPITDGITLRVGKFGPYLEMLDRDGDPGRRGPRRANVPEDLAPDELTAAKARELMEAAAPRGARARRGPAHRQRSSPRTAATAPTSPSSAREMTEETRQPWTSDR